MAVGKAVLNDKLQVARTLRDISLLLQLRGENAFKSRAYDLGADRIAGLTEDLGKLVEEGRLTELPGIGEALAAKVTELVTTGKLAYLDEVRGDFPASILELLALPDLGPKKVAALWRQLQVGDIHALHEACVAHRVRALKGFGEKTEQKILEGITRYRRAHSRRLLGDALPQAHALLQHVRSAPGVIGASLGGSVRRGCETVSDVDLIVSAAAPGPVMDALCAYPGVTQVIGRGDTKCSVRVGADELQVDMRVLPDEDFATALHHFTGSKAHHIRLRGLAQDKGLKVSEWGVHRGEEKLAVPNEGALYELLGLQYVPPELREDQGEVEAALVHALPPALVELDQVQGVVHSHSTWSDGKNTLEEMARAAQALGLSYLTVTEHSSAAAYAGGLTPDRLEAQWEEIDRIDAALPGFRLIKGLEVDILEDGGLDLPDALLDRLEVVIASVHMRHQMDEAQMTTRILKALDHPRTHILGHPTGRLIPSREPAPMRMGEILDRAAARGVAVEVNGNPERLDLKADHVRMALERGVKLVVSADSHSTQGLAHLVFSVATARRGWATARDVLNTRPADAFLAALRRT